MNVLKIFRITAISTLTAIGLAACDRPDPAETAETSGQQMDQTTERGASAGDQNSTSGEQTARAGAAVNDAEITTMVKSAISAEPQLKAQEIGVNTEKGVVTLSGSVDSMSTSDRAAALAREVAGVKEVDNRLMVKSTG